MSFLADLNTIVQYVDRRENCVLMWRGLPVHDCCSGNSGLIPPLLPPTSPPGSCLQSPWGEWSSKKSFSYKFRLFALTAGASQQAHGSMVSLSPGTLSPRRQGRRDYVRIGGAKKTIKKHLEKVFSLSFLT